MQEKTTFSRTHLIDDAPFEVFYHGTWYETNHITIKDGILRSKFHQCGSIVEEEIRANNIRLRSRKAESFDCQCFLRPGIDICVTSKYQCQHSSEQSVFRDAKVVSITKSSHDDRCTCKFFVKLYKRETVNNAMTSILNSGTKEIGINDIAITQKLKNSNMDGHHVWNSSLNCLYMYRSRLLVSGFGSEIASLAVYSLLKGMAFQVRSMRNMIVYIILDPSNSNENSEVGTQVLDFRTIHGELKPEIVALDVVLSRSTSRKIYEVDFSQTIKQEESPWEFSCESFGVRRSKRMKIAPDRFVSNFERRDWRTVEVESEPCETNKSEFRISPDDSKREVSKKIQPKEERQADGSNHEESKIIQPKERCRADGSKSDVSKKIQPRERRQAGGRKHDVSKKIQPRERRQINGCLSKEMRRVFMSPSESESLMLSRMRSIDLEKKKQVKQPQMICDWGSDCLDEVVDFNWGDDVVAEANERDYGDMWKEMEYVLVTTPYLEQEPEQKQEHEDMGFDFSHDFIEQECKHELFLDEELGHVCCLCKSIITERRYILPSFCRNPFNREPRIRNEYWGTTSTSNHQANYFPNLVSSNDAPSINNSRSVWNLIPKLRKKLYPHQKSAFEVIWRNIGGSLKPNDMNIKRTGGCVISHSPGTGKTLLVVAFLASFLKVFPRHCPLVLVPKNAINVWIKEFEKWEAGIPLHILHSHEVYRKMPKKCEAGNSSGSTRKASLKMAHILDCLEKLQKWHETPSVMLMSYPSFLSLSQRDRDYDKGYIAKSLLESPGIMVLDEGHNPRSTKSKLRRKLMEVKTTRRILLSGTLFQNNFDEYFNTLSLARPTFVSDTMRELNHTFMTYYNRKNQKAGNKREEFSRKLFVEEIGTKIESKDEHEMRVGLEKLIKMTEGFVDVYAGGTLDTLPGLEAYTIVLNSSGIQKKILHKLCDLKRQKGTLELHTLVIVASIHPCLMGSISGVKKYFMEQELKEVEKYESDHTKGSKIKFVVDLVHKCSLRHEKVLIFCHNISPLRLLTRIFQSIFGWHYGEEILVIQGDQNLSERADMMDKFKDSKWDCSVLLASTTACCEAISLTAASRVVLMDSEWNHSITKQAIARAFRPGQEKVVYAYQLLASGTLEEEKHVAKERKEWLSSMLVARKYIKHSSFSSFTENIEDELLNELVEENQTKAFNMIRKHH